MKTVFVLLPASLTVRNFLYTGVLDRVAARDDVRVIAFTGVPDMSARYPQASERLLFEHLPKQPRYTLSRLLNRALRARFYKINENRSMKSAARTLRSVKPLIFLFETLISQPLPRSQTLFRWIRALEKRRGGVSGQVRSLFERYEPSLVVSTHPTTMFEYDFLRHARKTGVTTVGFIRSWDILTTKGYIPVPVDLYLVWNQVIKAELLQLYGLPDEVVGITGIPQFDIYADTTAASSREEFLREHGLNPDKKTVLFAMSPRQINAEEPAILKRLAAALEASKGDEVQVLARLHQLDDMGRYQGISYPNLAFQVPGASVASHGEGRLLDPAYMMDLRDTLVHTDVVVNTASTMTIDAAALDRPVVNIAFDLDEKAYDLSVRRYFDWVHIQPIVKSGASRLAGSFDELMALVLRYLDNPGLEREQRAQLREAMCYKIDGKSAQRVADYLLRALDEKSFSAKLPQVSG